MHFSVFGLIQERHEKISNDDTLIIQCQTEWYTTLLKKKQEAWASIKTEHLHYDRGDVSIFLGFSRMFSIQKLVTFQNVQISWLLWVRLPTSQRRGPELGWWDPVRTVSPNARWDSTPQKYHLGGFVFFAFYIKIKDKIFKRDTVPHLSNAYHVTLHDFLYPCNP